MPAEARHYTFNPLERRGLLAGFQASQVAMLAAGSVVGVGILAATPTPAGMVAGAGAVAAAAALALWTVSGRPPAAWAPVGTAWLWRRLSRSRTSPLPLAGHRPGQPADGPPPPPLAGLRLLATPPVPGVEPMGVVHDRRAGTYAAILVVRGRSFSLLNPAEKQRRLAAWGAALAALAREGSPVHRIQWIERTRPGDSDGLLRYLDEGPGAARAGTVTPSC